MGRPYVMFSPVICITKDIGVDGEMRSGRHAEAHTGRQEHCRVLWQLGGHLVGQLRRMAELATAEARRGGDGIVREEEEMLLSSSWHPSLPLGRIGGVPAI